MKIVFSKASAEEYSGEAIVLPVFKEDKKKGFPELRKANTKILKLIKNKKFSTTLGTTKIIESGNGIKAKNIVLIGMGSKNKIFLEKVRVFAGHAVKISKKEKISSLGIIAGFVKRKNNIFFEALIEALILANYSFNQFKSKKEKNSIKKVELVNAESFKNQQIKKARKIAESKIIARDLVNLPSNIKTPEYIAKFTVNLFKKNRQVKVRVLNEKQAKKLGMNCLLTVGQSSANPPRFIVIEYKAPNPRKKIVIAGKGVTFDTGGINTKPFNYMKNMKQDMAGAAAVLGAMKAVSDLRIPVHLIGLMPLAENMVNGKAMKHGDIIKALNGKTIEIVHSDAEGRLLLADALSYSNKFKPDYVIDIATLTGACMYAVGPDFTGLLTKNKELAKKIKKAGFLSGEKVWRLPLIKKHEKRVESEIADVRNLSKGETGYSGASTAAAFLKAFVETKNWAHLDIAATAFYENPETSQPYLSKGATGVGVGLLTRLIEML